MKRVRSHLQELVDELDRVTRFTSAGRDAFLADERTQYAVIRCYEIIGEIVKRLPETYRDTHDTVDWRILAGFRDFLAHRYDEIVLEFVWAAVEDVPSLRSRVMALLEMSEE